MLLIGVKKKGGKFQFVPTSLLDRSVRTVQKTKKVPIEEGGSIYTCQLSFQRCEVVHDRLIDISYKFRL